MTSSEYKRFYRRERYARKRNEFFCDKKCEWCGSTDNLVLHHVDAKDKISNVVWNWSKKKIDEELAKCIVVCNDCHVKYHANEQRDYAHGRSSMYTKYKCRCDLCRHAFYKVCKRDMHLYRGYSEACKS